MTGAHDGTVTVTRPEAEADADATRALLKHAFQTQSEAKLVDRLRREGDLLLGMVATDSVRGVVGYIAFPRLRVEHAGQQFPAVGLAPLAVAEAHRRLGIGADLVCGGLDCLALRGETLVFVLGSPAYYTRFGFAREAARPFSCAYDGPHFMALRLADNAPRTGTIRYPVAFDALG